jgi:hypothetical protein
MNILQPAPGGQQYASNFSRSQSRLKQANKNIFNQFKNVVNLNGQVEKGFATYNNIGLGQNQQNGKPSFIGAGGMAVNAKGPMMVSHHMMPGQPVNMGGLPSKLNSTIGSLNMNHRKLVKQDDDDPPPPISQNHYRHIHE